MRLAQRRFYLSDQERFADASGDRNPMRVDALKARRTQAGAPVVHGIHLLLWALDSLATAQPDLPPLRCIRVQFNKFVYLDESVEVVLSQQGPTRARLNISVDDVPRSKVMLDFGDPVEDCPRVSTASPDLGTLQTEPLNLNFESVAGRSGHFRFPMTPEVAAKLFPTPLNGWVQSGLQRWLPAPTWSEWCVPDCTPFIASYWSAPALNPRRGPN